MHCYITELKYARLGICTKNLLHKSLCTHFSIQNIQRIRKNTINEKWCAIQEVTKHGDVLWCLQYCVFQIPITQKAQWLHKDSLLLIAQTKKYLTQRKKTFSMKIQMIMDPSKWNHNDKIQFIYVKFKQIHVPCLLSGSHMSLNSLRGCATKSLFQNTTNLSAGFMWPLSAKSNYTCKNASLNCASNHRFYDAAFGCYFFVLIFGIKCWNFQQKVVINAENTYTIKHVRQTCNTSKKLL